MASDPKISLTPRMKSLSFQDGTVTQNSYSGSSFSSEAASSCDCFVTSFPHFRKALKQVIRRICQRGDAINPSCLLSTS
jgi:hypothetical protein